MLQTILGSGGSIGIPLAKELLASTKEIRLVSRHPEKVNSTDELFATDLTQREQVFTAVKGSSIVYLTAGLEYKLSAWQSQWPVVMRNVIDACIQHEAKLVFFDNIYMVDPGHLGNITEMSPINPCSRKGKIRAELDKMIMDSITAGKIQAIIARSADFYGPLKSNSLLIETIYKNLKKGKEAQWFCNAKKKHSCTYVPDAAKAVAILGNTPDAFNQVWNLPTHEKALTAEEWTLLFANALNSDKTSVKVMPKWALKILGIFIPILSEFHDIAYQYDRDYVFDSTKFCTRFGFKPTSPEEGVKQTVAALTD